MWLVAALGLPAARPQTPGWTLLKTDHFAIYSDATDTRLSAVVLHILEQERSVLMRTPLGKYLPEKPATVLILKDNDEFRKYSPSEAAFAWYNRIAGNDYVVLGPASAVQDRVIRHEYVHCAIRHTGWQLPLWLQEGLADVYSSVRVTADRTEIGAEIPAYRGVLGVRSFDVNGLLSVDRSSLYAQDAAKLQVYYARAWALTHMLLLGSGCGGNCGLLEALSRGVSVDKVLESDESIRRELAEYLRARHWPTVSYALPGPLSVQAEDLRPDQTEVQSILGAINSDTLRLRNAPELTAASGN